jgi:hypothetical protein
MKARAALDGVVWRGRPARTHFCMKDWTKGFEGSGRKSPISFDERNPTFAPPKSF